MPYLILNNQQAADDRSRQAWEQVLGRQKNPADVTEFLWGRSAPGLDGRVAVVIPSDNTTWGISQDKVNSVTISAQEQSSMVSQLDPINWPPQTVQIGGRVG